MRGIVRGYIFMKEELQLRYVIAGEEDYGKA